MGMEMKYSDLTDHWHWLYINAYILTIYEWCDKNNGKCK